MNAAYYLRPCRFLTKMRTIGICFTLHRIATDGRNHSTERAEFGERLNIKGIDGLDGPYHDIEIILEAQIRPWKAYRALPLFMHIKPTIHGLVFLGVHGSITKKTLGGQVWRQRPAYQALGNVAAN